MENQIKTLLNKVADSMDCTVIKCNATTKDIMINRFVDTSSYITKEELFKLKEKMKYL